MRPGQVCLAAAVVLAGAAAVFAGRIQNGSFEIDFSQSEGLTAWGDHGHVWGQAYQVEAGPEKEIRKARNGTRVLLLNVPPDSWDGAWQQIPWAENAAFAWQAYYLIQDGDLETNCATFMKVEFYDANDGVISFLEGERRREATSGRWVRDSMKGTTPTNTAAIRFILIAGPNEGGTGLVNRIFWDDADTTE